MTGVGGTDYSISGRGRRGTISIRNSLVPDALQRVALLRRAGNCYAGLVFR